ncbi:MAG TPA: sigma factor-like helix-turn-helix DNA-binding protein, partial [Galbitalea sp.]
LTPAERLAFVLHDLFDLPYEEIAPMLGSTPSSARQLASRARRRVKGAEVRSQPADVNRQRRVVDAFFAAARDGDFDGLVAVLHPEVVLRIDAGSAFPAASMVVRGAENVATQSGNGMKSVLSRAGTQIQHILVNGAAGVIVTLRERPVTVMGFTFADGRILEIDSISEPARVERITAG